MSKTLTNAFLVESSLITRTFQLTPSFLLLLPQASLTSVKAALPCVRVSRPLAARMRSATFRTYFVVGWLSGKIWRLYCCSISCAACGKRQHELLAASSTAAQSIHHLAHLPFGRFRDIEETQTAGLGPLKVIN